jgi:hypothetical protein
MRRESAVVVMAFHGGVLRPLVCFGVVSLAVGARPLRCGCIGSLHGGGLNEHCGPAAETTLVLWRSLGVPASMGEDVKVGSASAAVCSFLAWTFFGSWCGSWLWKALTAVAIAVPVLRSR